MLLSILAFLLAASVLGKVLFLICYPKAFTDVTKDMCDWIQKNFALSQAITIALVIVSGMIISELSSFSALIAGGWFWASVYMAILLPIYTSKHMDKLLTTLINESKTQIHLKIYLIICGAVSFATMLYLLNPAWLLS